VTEGVAGAACEYRCVTDRLPDGLTIERHHSLVGRSRHVWYRRALLSLVAVIPILALLNVFGQEPHTSVAANSAASLQISVPSALRGGLEYQIRTQVTARQTLNKPQLIFSQGWWQSVGVNSIEPDPASQATKNGSVVLSFDKLPAGRSLTVWMNFTANPDNAGRRATTVQLADGPTTIASIHRSLTFFP
jgi:hypothetical protein